LQDLTNVSSTAPGSGDNGKALVWNNTAGLWAAGNISRGNVNLVNGGITYTNSNNTTIADQSFLSINAAGTAPSPLFVKGAFVSSYGQFSVEAGAGDNRAGFGLFGAGGSPRYVFFLGGPDASGLFSQSETFFIFSQRPSPNTATFASFYFTPFGRLTIDVANESTSTTTGNFVAPGGIGIGGNGTFGGYLRIVNSSPPANSGDTGLVGQMAWDSSYFYVCIAVNTWKRVALSTW
jgi:hypothetical protein